MKLKNLFLLLISLFTLTLFTSCDTVPKERQLSKEQIFDKVEEMMVKIYTYDITGKNTIAQGTGFICNELSFVITNYHVLEGAYSARVFSKYKTNESFDVEYVTDYNSRTSDYVILNTSKKSQDYNYLINKRLPFATEYKAGDIVYSIGYPDNSSQLEIHEGKIIGTTTNKGKLYIENTAYTDHGSSGGLLVNSAGEVLGIPSVGFDNGNYGAIPSSDFKNDTYSDKAASPRKLIAEVYHETKIVTLTKYNFLDYFDIYYTYVKGTDLGFRYNLYVCIKEGLEGRVLFGITGKIKLVVKMETTWVVLYENIGSATHTDDRTAAFYFYKIEDFPQEKTIDNGTYPRDTVKHVSQIGPNFSIDSIEGEIIYIY